MSVIDDLVRGSIDMHVHPAPDAVFPRRLDALDMARDYQRAGIRAAVFKNQYPTTPSAQLINRLVPDFTAFGGLCLDTVIGGLNPVAVTNSAKLGAKVIWMPVGSAAHWKRNKDFGNSGITILDGEGKLLRVVGKILDIIKKYDMVLATAHISFSETLALIKEARRRGVDRIIVTHGSLSFTIDQQVKLADAGAVVEHCCMAVLTLALRKSDEHLLHSDWPWIISSIRNVGAKRCLMSTDMGMAGFPSPVEGMRIAVSALLEGGLTPREVEILVKENPARLLGLPL